MGRLLLLLMALSVSACSTLPSGKRWGEEVHWLPSAERLSASAVRAARDPASWGPALAATLLMLDGHRYDQQIADWAVRERPLFGGGREQAFSASDSGRDLVEVGYWLSALLTSGGEHSSDWWQAKAQGMGVMVGISLTANTTTNILKKAVRMKEAGPDDQGHYEFESFPSNHASVPFTKTAVIRRNLAESPLAPWQRHSANTVMTLAASASAWGRIEGGTHYPSDILGGVAVGNFLGLFLYDAWLGDGGETQTSARLRWSGTTPLLTLGWRY